MGTRHGFRAAAATLVLAGLVLSPLRAQFPPEELQNLKVLPPTTEVRELINVMRGFAQSLGVRCQYCHVGRADQPLSEFDFVSDEKATKQTAREMLQMVMAINQTHLANLPVRGDPPLEVQCAMCHRGQARPMTTQQAVLAAVEAEGADAGVERYRQLRARYHGSHTYDFTEMVLLDVAGGLAQAEQFDAALAIAGLNLEFFEASSPTHTTLGQLYMLLEQPDQAIEQFERALEIDPRNRAAQGLLDRLRGNQ